MITITEIAKHAIIISIAIVITILVVIITRMTINLIALKDDGYFRSI